MFSPSCNFFFYSKSLTSYDFLVLFFHCRLHRGANLQNCIIYSFCVLSVAVESHGLCLCTRYIMFMSTFEIIIIFNIFFCLFSANRLQSPLATTPSSSGLARRPSNASETTKRRDSKPDTREPFRL